jgi:hypothetical protein
MTATPDKLRRFQGPGPSTGPGTTREGSLLNAAWLGRLGPGLGGQDGPGLTSMELR